MNNVLSASDVMTTEVVTLKKNDSLSEAWLTLAKHKISGAPVLSNRNRVVGVLSQTDILRTAFFDEFDYVGNGYYFGYPVWEGDLIESYGDRLSEVLVEEAMSDDVLTAAPDQDIGALAAMMRHRHIHRVIITTNEELVGVVSSLDLLKVLEKQ